MNSTFHNFSKFADIALHMSGTHLKHHPLNTHTTAKTFSAFPENFISDSLYNLKKYKYKNFVADGLYIVLYMEFEPVKNVWDI